MSDHDQATEELAGLALDAIEAGAALWHAFWRAVTIILIALVVIGAPFFVWGLLVGW